MERNVDMNEISDGNLYGPEDLVRADALGCQGCSHCCRTMVDTILLDPYDIFCLCQGLDTDFSALMQSSVELNVQEGLILPNLKKSADQAGCCFLNQENRCSIHAFRPGFCRLFPLGRFYDGKGFSYFLQTKECPVPKKGKVKVRKWLGIPDYPHYAEFITSWHYFLKSCSVEIRRRKDQTFQKEVSLSILQIFYGVPYHTDQDFYSQYSARLAAFQQTFPLPGHAV